MVEHSVFPKNIVTRYQIGVDVPNRHFATLRLLARRSINWANFVATFTMILCDFVQFSRELLWSPSLQLLTL